jgi:hypothetical protein
MPSSQYFAEVKLNWLRGTAAPAALTNLYVSLHTADPGANGINNDVTAAVASARGVIPIANLSAPTAAAGGGFQISNTASLVMTNSALAIATLTHVGFWNALSGGNFICYGTLSPATPVAIGDVLRFAVGQLVIKER